jgi:DNA-binding GntR family transcriptional regulator
MTSTPAPYLLIADALRTRITSGELPPGTRLPSVADLGAEHGVSPSVGARAYRLLEDEGLVIARHGAGTYVRAPEAAALLVRRHASSRGSDSPRAQDAAQQGTELKWDSHSTTARATAAVAARLRIAEGDPVMHTSYVYRAEGTPVQLADSWEPLAITGPALISLPELGPMAGVGVAARMRSIGIEVVAPVERVRARGATRAEATALGCSPSAHVLAIQRTYYAQETGVPVETADIVLLGSRWEAVYGAEPGA